MRRYEEMLKNAGLLRYGNNPERLRLEVLGQLGLLDLKDDPVALSRAIEKRLEDLERRLKQQADEIGDIIQRKLLGRIN